MTLGYSANACFAALYMSHVKSVVSHARLFGMARWPPLTGHTYC